MAAAYFSVLLLVLASVAVVAAMLLLNALLGPKRKVGDPGLDPSRWTPFECGHDPIQRDNTRRVSVKFYLVAILFVLFDLEVVLLYPWAVVARDLGLFGFAEITVFLATLVVGLVFAWKKGALEWR